MLDGLPPVVDGLDVDACATMLVTVVPLVGRPLFVVLVADEFATTVALAGIGKPVLGVVTTGAGVVTTGAGGLGGGWQEMNLLRQYYYQLLRLCLYRR